MSIRLMSIVWDIEFPTQSQKLLMLKLADYASDSGGSVFPATETLADKTGCDERTIQRAMKALLECGILHLVRQGGGAPGSTNEWRLDVDVLTGLFRGNWKLEGTATELKRVIHPRQDATPGNLSGGVTNTPGGVTPVSPTPGTTAGGLITNHHVDPSRAGVRASEGARTPALNEKKEVAIGKKKGPAVAIDLTPTDPSWGHWLSWMTDKGRRDQAVAATESGHMIVGSRWPANDSRFPRIDQGPAIARRKLGDAA